MKLTAHDMPRSYWRKQAEANGIFLKTFDSRLSRGWTPQQAATEPPAEGKGWKSTGSTDAEVSRAYGLHWEAVRKWRRRHGDDDTPAEVIAGRLVAFHERETLKGKALAMEIDASQQSVSAWCLGRTTPGAEFKRRLLAIVEGKA